MCKSYFSCFYRKKTKLDEKIIQLEIENMNVRINEYTTDSFCSETSDNNINPIQHQNPIKKK